LITIFLEPIKNRQLNSKQIWLGLKILQWYAMIINVQSLAEKLFEEIKRKGQSTYVMLMVVQTPVYGDREAY